MPSTQDFRTELTRMLQTANDQGNKSLVVTARDLHKQLDAKALYPSCCNAMWDFFDEKIGDEIVYSPPSGKGPRLSLRYKLPKQLATAKLPKKVAGPIMTSTSGKCVLEDRVDHLIENFEECLDHFYDLDVFTGPCVYFHEKAIRIRNSHSTAVDTLTDDSFFDAMYATLTAWGMHRLGTRGAKLRDIKEIRQSFLEQKELIQSIQHVSLIDLASNEVSKVGKKLRTIIENLRVGANNTMLVAGTKAIHHLFPSLCPPIDNAYTLRFFYGTFSNSKNEGKIFEEIFLQFHRIGFRCRDIIARRLEVQQGMNSSETKIIDNAIIGYVKEYHKPEKLS